MPTSVVNAGDAYNPAAQVVAPASIRGGWVVANSDAKTAQSAADLLAPLGCTDSAVRWVRVPSAASAVVIRARYPSTATTFSTSPVVRVYGVYGDTGDSPAANDGAVPIMRIDAASATASGLTVPVAAAASSLANGSVRYSGPTSLVGLDCKCATYIGVFVETAAVLGSGSGDVVIEVMFEN